MNDNTTMMHDLNNGDYLLDEMSNSIFFSDSPPLPDGMDSIQVRHYHHGADTTTSAQLDGGERKNTCVSSSKVSRKTKHKIF
jgi:hypothetical protein